MSNSQKDIMNEVVAVLSSEIQLKHVMMGHGLFSIALGIILILLPHSFSSTLSGNHIAHEFLRLYGAVNVGLGWFAWRAERIGLSDGRIKKLVCEVFTVCYAFQFLILLRAHFSVPDGHSAVHVLIGFIFGLIASLYGYMRFGRKIKEFELPNSRSA